MKQPRCTAINGKKRCQNKAVYEHQHIEDPSEWLCEEHWRGCARCVRRF